MIISNTLFHLPVYFVSLEERFEVQGSRVFFIIDVILFVIDVCSAYGTVLNVLQALSKNSVEELSTYVCHCGEDSRSCSLCGE